MATFASDSNTAEMGRTRSHTIETLVAEREPMEGASTSSPPAVGGSSSVDDHAASPAPSTTAPKKPDWSRAPKLRDVHRFPKGFPRLAAQQTYAYNGSIHRRYETAGELLISYREYEVGFAEQRIYEWYSKHPEACKRLSTGQKQEPGNTCDMEEIDALYEALERPWLKYHMLLIAQKEKRTLLSPHKKEIRSLYEDYLVSQGMTDEDAFLPGYAADDDFCTTALHQEHLPARDLLHSSLGRRAAKKLPFVKFNEDSGGYLLPTNAILLVLEVFRMSMISSLMLIPIGIMLFGGLDIRGIFGVFVGSVFVVCIIVVLGRGIGMGDVGTSTHGYGVPFNIVAGYTAVLATFVAQLVTSAVL